MIGIFYVVPFVATIAFLFAWYFFVNMKKENQGSEKMVEIASRVAAGAMVYLKQQYKVVVAIFILIAMLLACLSYGFGLQNRWVPFAFLTAGFCSGLAGFCGMITATSASSRTAYATSKSLNAGLKIAFRSGAVMGLVVVGLALVDYSIWFLILNRFSGDLIGSHKLIWVTNTMLTFAMGTSLQALFARVGGGIFTKAADVGADLVGKVEAGIPEDDPRNPATIADNVGDNVGDVAGMGADLYESYYGSILAAAALGAAAFAGSDPKTQLMAVIAPVMICIVGIVASIIGIFFVKTREGASSLELLKSLSRGIRISSLIICVGSFIVLKLLNIPNAIGIWGAVMFGLLTGIYIGKATEYFTSEAYGPTKMIAQNATTGSATVIISGFGTGMLSTFLPVLTVTIGTMLAFYFASGFDASNVSMGLYGIGLAAVGMLSTLGITLATDAYGPIADNAGGNAEMSGLPPEVRQKTDALDSLGNTTAATGKGFAIGSAALTALALITSYVEGIRLELLKTGQKFISVGNVQIDLTTAKLCDIMHCYDVHMLNPKVMSGMFIGAMLTFVFCGLTTMAVGRAAGKMVIEVRKQFREIKGIMTGESIPDYGRCITIATTAAQKEMIIPALIAIVSPILISIIFGVPGILGLLGGSLSTGFVLASFMSNAGGAWDNAKKYIESGVLGGKHSEAHKATVIGDTVGDPFKDTAGPSLNILIKLMAIVSLVTIGIAISYSLL
ncbi:MAG: sodium-translocating pyrophosphatase [Puniceicoccales bacterium]|jgi:K(+)-stimulated pyrophosphate-energized sodium pump|nr:sodium-translocating pyrophosphatase [Puniceicoccales bacterium]